VKRRRGIADITDLLGGLREHHEGVDRVALHHVRRHRPLDRSLIVAGSVAHPRAAHGVVVRAWVCEPRAVQQCVRFGFAALRRQECGRRLVEQGRDREQRPRDRILVDRSVEIAQAVHDVGRPLMDAVRVRFARERCDQHRLVIVPDGRAGPRARREQAERDDEDSGLEASIG